ncbi:hypothetical protein QBC37DRAFT_154559 [Rhypophila decipiens]|uniref:Uncharacterized protein n=1 Tax=Rhypophila decipiens TaxID=261697 RepID=A0AAN6YIY1_9PEZI|nr:hypothetical protein QBC37DRAFT_154559 [Rhypophila decipiens]
MHNHRLNEAEADIGSGLSDSRTEPLTGDNHESRQLPELQSSSLPTPTPPPSTSRSPSRTVRELAHKLSQQNLRLEENSTAQAINPPSLDAAVSASVAQSISQPPLPKPVISQDLAILPDVSDPPWAALEVDDEAEGSEDVLKNDPPYLSLLSVARRRSQYLRGESSSMGAGEGGLTRSSGARLRKQMSSQFRDKPAATIANTARVEKMISSGTQCNVQNAAPASTSSTAPAMTSSASTVVEPPKPQTTTDYVYSPMELEVDEAYCNGADTFEEDLSFVEAVVSLRRAGAPGGIRKTVVNGIPLRYQLSADAAMRCQTVVKNRPRMRRRKTVRSESVASSAVTSAISSPVIPPSIPSPHLNPYE